MPKIRHLKNSYTLNSNNSSSTITINFDNKCEMVREDLEKFKDSVINKKIVWSLWEPGFYFIPNIIYYDGIMSGKLYQCDTNDIVDDDFSSPVHNGFNIAKGTIVKNGQWKMYETFQCSCHIVELMNRGCTCGIFKKEKETV